MAAGGSLQCGRDKPGWTLSHGCVTETLKDVCSCATTSRCWACVRACERARACLSGRRAPSCGLCRGRVQQGSVDGAGGPRVEGGPRVRRGGHLALRVPHSRRRQRCGVTWAAPRGLLVARALAPASRPASRCVRQDVSRGRARHSREKRGWRWPRPRPWETACEEEDPGGSGVESGHRGAKTQRTLRPRAGDSRRHGQWLFKEPRVLPPVRRRRAGTCPPGWRSMPTSSPSCRCRVLCGLQVLQGPHLRKRFT